MTITELFDYANKATLIPLLFYIGWAGHKKYWVYGYQLAERDKQIDDLRAQCNRWEQMALRLMGQVDKATVVAEKAIGGGGQ